MYGALNKHTQALNSSMARMSTNIPQREPRALSVRQPWADLITDGRKTIENRSWAPRYRGLLLVHASKTVDWTAVRRCMPGDYSPITGAIIGSVRLIDITTDGRESAWRDPIYRYGWVLAAAQRFADPIPYRGQCGLFVPHLPALE